MHEASLVDALFDQADRAVAPRTSASVRRLAVRIGELAGVDATLFEIAFAGLKDERGYEAAILEIALEPAVWRCRACGESPPAGGRLRCPRCEGAVELAQGDGIFLDRIELEVSDV